MEVNGTGDKRHCAARSAIRILLLGAAALWLGALLSSTAAEPAAARTVKVRPAQPSPAPRRAAEAPDRENASPRPSPSVSPEPAENGFLVLVNWDNPITDLPEDLVRISQVIDGDAVIFRNPGHEIDRTAGMAANEMFKAAKLENIGEYIINSAYRSPGTQAAIWKRRIRRDPDYGMDPFSEPVKAMPGDRSEHSTGLALDILCKSHNRADEAYGDTAEGRWLAENAHRFGFILRYPKDKEHITGVIYEPWHLRYVGAEAAAEIYERGLCLEEDLEGRPESSG